MSTRSPVLFMVFNRPQTTERVFEAVRKARPSRLYVAADGPRVSREGEARRCELVRAIATAVDWPCEVRTLFRDANLGCKAAVSSAITWFFEHEPEGIILEDDCLPHPSFFAYCDALLERYRHEQQVFCVSGVNFIAKHWQPDTSYYFSRYAHIWGWASWRRAWQHYDVSMASWRASRDDGLLRATFPDSGPERRYWRQIFDRVSSGEIDTWDYQWAYACWRQRGLTCLPRANLITNIGFGADATHTVSAESKMANLPVSNLALPFTHPERVDRMAHADRWTSSHVFDIEGSWWALVRRRLAGRLERACASVGL